MALPMKRLHPDHRGEEEGDEWIYTVEDEGGEQNEESEADMADPRWAALKQLNFGNSDSENKNK